MQNREGSTAGPDGPAERCECASDVTALGDGELTPERAGEVRRHLADCVRCRAQLEAEMQLSARITDAVERERERGRRARALLGAILGASILGNFLAGPAGAAAGAVVAFAAFRARYRRDR